MYKDKKVLVTGGTGLIGMPLVEMLLKRGAKVRVVSLDNPSRISLDVEFMRLDLMWLDNCLEACRGMDFVFNLVGIKGSPAVTRSRPASFFVPTILFNTNMMEAARRSGVKRYLYTSSIGVYSPADVFYEDDLWKTFPSENDKFAGWAKRMGELQAEAYKIEYSWKDIVIVRPANVYGPHDNFDLDNAMVIPSLIKKAMEGEGPLVIWGDGSAIRDFIYSDDVARAMILAMEKMPVYPINLGSGEGVSIKKIVDIIVNNLNKRPKIIWDTTKPTGDKIRLMDVSRAKSLGFSPNISIEEGIKKTMAWYGGNKNVEDKRYNVFTKK